MSVAFVTSNNSGAGDNKTVSAPASIVNGNTLVLVAWYYVDATGTPSQNNCTPPAGFTSRGKFTTTFTDTGSPTVFQHRITCEVFTKVASNESGSYTVTISDSGYTNLAILQYSGVDKAAPVSVGATANPFGPSSTSYTATWLDTAVPRAGSIALIIGAAYAFTCSQPSGTIARITDLDGTNDVAEVAVAPASTGTFTGTVAADAVNHQNAFLAINLVLQPQAPLPDGGWQSQAGGIARAAVTVIAPVGALLAATSLTSIAWANPTPLPPAPQVPNRPTPEISAPIGSATFALAKSPAQHGSDQARPKPSQPPLRVETVAPVGALITSTLSSVGWGPAPPLPPNASPARPRVEASAPIGTGTFALAKFPHSSELAPRGTVVPPREQQAQQPVGPLKPFVSASTGWFPAVLPFDAPLVPPKVSESAPVGTLMSVSASLGWFQVDATPPAPRSLVFTAVIGDELVRLPTALSSIGWLTNDPAPRNALASARRDAQASQPTGPLQPFVSLSTGWFPSECRNPALSPPRPEPSAPVGPLKPFVSTTLGWLNQEAKSPVLPAPRAQEAQQPTGPLAPFVSASSGWLRADLPFDAPLLPPRVAESAPVGTLLTPQPFGWNAGHDQARPTPVIARRVDPIAPVGTAFAITLPSNGWLATDDPRTPLRLSRSVPTDPVGNLLVIPPLPGIGWLATDNPRTPYRSQRAVPVDPVGTPTFALPRLHWSVEAPPRPRPTAPQVAPVEPVGSRLATLSSVGWLSALDLPRAQASLPRVGVSDPLGPLLFGGSPWAAIEVARPRTQRAPISEPSAPTGPLTPFVSLSAPWLQLEAPRAPVASQQRHGVSQPVGSPLAQFGSLGWLGTESRRGYQPNARQLGAEPIGALITPPPPISSFGWMVLTVALPRPPGAMATEGYSAALLPRLVLSVAAPLGRRLATTAANGSGRKLQLSVTTGSGRRLATTKVNS